MLGTQRVSKNPGKGWFQYLKVESERHILIKSMFERVFIPGWMSAISMDHMQC